MHIIYVDDEKPALDNFKWTVSDFPEIGSLELFQDGREALEHVRCHTVDVAFLDMEMPEIHGLKLAQMIKEHDEKIRVVFVTAFSQYALDAWNVDASGYLLKPYTASDIRKLLYKCAYRPLPSQNVEIQTIPTFRVTVSGSAIPMSAAKPRELLALIVDRGEEGIGAGDGIACLWPDRANDANTQALFRMTFKRLTDILEEAGIRNLIYTRDNKRYLNMDNVDCDLYRIMAGDIVTARKYSGQYLREYSWAEERNSQLYWMLRKNMEDIDE